MPIGPRVGFFCDIGGDLDAGRALNSLGRATIEPEYGLWVGAVEASPFPLFAGKMTGRPHQAGAGCY